MNWIRFATAFPLDTKASQNANGNEQVLLVRYIVIYFSHQVDIIRVPIHSVLLCGSEQWIGSIAVKCRCYINTMLIRSMSNNMIYIFAQFLANVVATDGCWPYRFNEMKKYARTCNNNVSRIADIDHLINSFSLAPDSSFLFTFGFGFGIRYGICFVYSLALGGALKVEYYIISIELYFDAEKEQWKY